MTLTVREIADLARFAGLTMDENDDICGLCGLPGADIECLAG